LREVEEKYSPRVLGKEGVSAYILLRNSEAVGYVQTYPVQDGEWGLRITSIAIGLDMFIGKPDLLHRGFGSRLLLQFLEDVVFSHDAIVQCFADPVCRNSAAVRAFAKAGFRHLKAVLSPETRDSVCVMCVKRSDYDDNLK
jgi:aminoglycoside 6'-N-acetyltransferase